MAHTAWVSFDGKDCSGCKHLNERGYCEFTACIIPCTVRATIPEAKPLTNADRIRAMTDEELAEWFIKIQDDVADYYDGGHAVAPELPTMKNSWLEWLKQEAEK